MPSAPPPVEKFVEVLFFALLLQANAGKSFFYAPLSGLAEAALADAIAKSGENKVYAFEFKRSFNSDCVESEWKKYGVNTKSHAIFEKLVNDSCAGDEFEHMKKCSDTGHVLVATNASVGTNTLQLNMGDASSSLQMVSYLHKLSVPDFANHDSKKRKALIELNNAGMTVADAHRYFEKLSEIKNKNGTNVKQGSGETVFGYFVSPDGDICAASADTYSDFSSLIQKVQKAQEHLSDQIPKDSNTHGFSP